MCGREWLQLPHVQLQLSAVLIRKLLPQLEKWNTSLKTWACLYVEARTVRVWNRKGGWRPPSQFPIINPYDNNVFASVLIFKLLASTMVDTAGFGSISLHRQAAANYQWCPKEISITPRRHHHATRRNSSIWYILTQFHLWCLYIYLQGRNSFCVNTGGLRHTSPFPKFPGSKAKSIKNILDMWSC